LTSIYDGASDDAGTQRLATPSWLFQFMHDEMSVRELGIGSIYSVLELLAQRYSLKDVVVTLERENFCPQIFRLGGKALSVDLVARLGHSPGVFCSPDVVPASELDAVRITCQIALSLHMAHFSAAHDSLTKIANRRTFDAALAAACARSARYDWGFTLLITDLNGFKAINDSLGHGAGDDLLRQFAFAMQRSVREGDLAARLGGDEFAVILNNAGGNEATSFTDRLRCYLGEASQLIDFTVGTATSRRDSNEPNELLAIADHRLLEKKGRNGR